MENSNNETNLSELSVEIGYFQELQQLEEFNDDSNETVHLSIPAINLIAKISDKKAILQLLQYRQKTTITMTKGLTKQNVVVPIDQTTFDKFGVNIFSRVNTPRGPATVIGYAPAIELSHIADHNQKLIFHIDGNSGASFWLNINDKETFNQRITLLNSPKIVEIPSLFITFSSKSKKKFMGKLKEALKDNEPNKITNMFSCLKQMQLSEKKMKVIIVLSESFITYLTSDINDVKYITIIEILSMSPSFYTEGHISLFRTYLTTLAEDKQDEYIESLNAIVKEHISMKILNLDEKTLNQLLLGNFRTLLAFIKLGIITTEICDIPKFQAYFTALNADNSVGAYIRFSRLIEEDHQMTFELLRITIESPALYGIKAASEAIKDAIIILKNICQTGGNGIYQKIPDLFLTAITALPGIDCDVPSSNKLFKNNQEKLDFVKKNLSHLFPAILTMTTDKNANSSTDVATTYTEKTPLTDTLINNNTLY